MNYWITTKWPPRKNGDEEESSFIVALQDGRENEAKSSIKQDCSRRGFF